MYKVVSITDMWGQVLPLHKMDILIVREGWVFARWKGFGFPTAYSACDGYTVITERVG